MWVLVFVSGKLSIELKGYAVFVSLILLVVFLRFGFGCGELSTL